MRDVKISAIVIFAFALLTFEHSSLIVSLVGAGLSIHLIWLLTGKKSPLRFHRFTTLHINPGSFTLYINLGTSVIFSVILLSVFPSNLFLGFMWGYFIGAVLTRVALNQTDTQL